ncbi:hypothetical protein EMIHUDRAFT_194958 [Emiliania huxleyi CCMP1516]|uniref:RING-type domain-containing protein n=2 Tax=Emiliania huxleyi TaxID=2903 RepID=A0A0D3JGP5_EMIH1|nr:hypothetical protein EMIHUDRAFT_194958 [Emiliania huxleyi CCMP1516]EOD22680.1 hypothetical protein EMIHUDRAFT_194958 [Emiliania huxleyi CCMP1516]|eukprot:XP_005775109.1 hypothetical protein EMIHUDRAFT_194958 [Emiliania huxleyi CCMP1516]
MPIVALVSLVIVAAAIGILRSRRRHRATEGWAGQSGLEQMPKDAITLAVHALPETTFHAEDGTVLDVSDCRLCLEEYASGDRLRRLPCGHVYHSACIDIWLAAKRDQGLPRGQRGCPAMPLDEVVLKAAEAAVAVACRHAASGPGMRFVDAHRHQLARARVPNGGERGGDEPARDGRPAADAQ